MLASARPGWEFLDWGRSHHVGGGSHGSLHADDSYGSLLWCGTGPDDPGAREQWTLRDIVPLVLGALRAAGLTREPAFHVKRRAASDQPARQHGFDRQSPSARPPQRISTALIHGSSSAAS